MSKSGTIVGLTGKIWAREIDGTIRLLSVGDKLDGTETLILAAGATITVSYGSGADVEVITFTGPESGYGIVAPHDNAAIEATPEVARMIEEQLAREPDDAYPAEPQRTGDGHRFVQLVRIDQDLETDAISPLDLARVKEVIPPMDVHWGRPELDGLDWRYSRGRDEEQPINRAPEPAPETHVIPEDTVATGNVLANDSDPESRLLTVTQFEVAGQVYTAGETAVLAGVGSIVINTDGSYTFTPVPDWNGVVPTITYTASDSGRGGTVTSTLDIAVEPATDIVADVISTHSGEPITSNVLGNDTFENDDAAVTAVTEGAHGTVVINPDGTVTYTPDDGYVGPDSYTYTVTSGGVTETTTVMIEVTNTVPVAAPEVETTPEDTQLGGNVLDNDGDGDGDPLIIAQFEIGGQAYMAGQTAVIAGVGTILLNADGSYAFVPVADWNGTVPTVTYTVIDGNQGGATTSTLDITVTPVGDVAPNAITTHAGEPVTTDVRDNDTFENADAEVTAVTQGAHGAVVINPDGTVTYTPGDGYVGPDSYSYTVTSGGVTETTTVTIEVTNAVPTALPEVETTPEDTPVSGNILDNESDADGDPLRVTQYEVGGQVYAAGQTAILAGIGTILINADGDYTFTPAANWNGTVPTITYTVSDGNQGGTATSTLDINVTPVNDAPDAIGLPARVDTDADIITGIDVTGGFSDIEGDTLSYTATGLPAGLTLDPVTGLISGTIDNSASQAGTAGNPAGVYTVVVTADDGQGGTVSHSFTWTVTNPVPDAVDDANATDEATPLTVSAAAGVLGNDSDPDGDTLTVSAVNGAAASVGAVVAGTSGGSFTLNADGSYDFDPNGAFEDLAAGETRATSITYTVSDGEGGTDTATLEVVVTGVNDAPVPVGTLPGQSNEDADGGISVDITAGFSDVDASDTLSYTATGLPAGLALDPATGLISGTIDNSASQTGTAGNPAGVYTVVVTADDGQGGTVSHSFTWTVANPVPDAASDQGSITEDGPDLVVSAANGVIESGSAVAGADIDPDGDSLAVTHVVVGTASDIGDFTGPANAGTQIVGAYGTLTLNADGSYTYVLDNGNPVVNALDGNSPPLLDIFSYAISDGEGGTAFTSLTISVAGNDDGAPSITPSDDNGATPGQVTVYEAGLRPDGPAGQSAAANGTIAISAANGIASVTIAGTILTLAQLEALSAGAPVAIDTPQGRLTLTDYVSTSEIGGVSTGGTLSFTYTLEDSFTNPTGASINTIEPIALAVEDAAGETESSVLDVNIIDDVATVGTPDSTSVAEVNLPAGTDPSPGSLTATGSLDVRIGADDASANTVFEAGQSAPAGLTSNGVQLVYVVSGDGHTLIATAGPGGPAVFTVALTNPGLASAGYSFVLLGTLDHGAANIELSFGFAVTDSDGDTASGSFQVGVADDAPVAVDQPAISLAEGGIAVGSATGGTNLLGNDEAGADGSANVVSITYTDEAGNGATVGVPTTGVTVDTRYGSLTVNPDGSWSYTSDATENNPAGVSDSFSYTIADSDGSTSTATQPLTITDTEPVAGPVGLVLDEQDIPGTGSAGSPDNSMTEDLVITRGPDAISDVVFDAASVSGLVVQNLTSGGTALVYTISGDGHTLTATAGGGGAEVFTLTLNNPADATGSSQSVTFTLSGRLDHSAANGENGLSMPVGYTVHDTDSVTAATLTLTVVDDVPTAQAGPTPNVVEGGQLVTGTSLLANDVPGADDARVYQVQYTNEAGVLTTASVAADPAGSTFNTIHGSLTVHRDGTWSFTSDPATASGTSVNHQQPANDLVVDEIFNYNVIDGDGDVSGWASQTIGISDTTASIGTPTGSTIDEANLPGGTDPAPAALTSTGALGVVKGADGIDVTFGASQTALQALNLTSGGIALAYVVSADGHSLVATAGAGGPTVFTATIPDPTSASASYSFVLSRALDHAEGSEIELPIAYGVVDADGDAASASVVITVVDDEPQTDRAFSLDEDSAGITFNISADSTGTNVTPSDPPNGTATVNPDGTMTYVPDPNFSGTDTFSYTTTGDDGSSVVTNVTVTVNPISDAPQLTIDAAAVQTNEDSLVGLGLNAPVVTDANDQNAGAAADNPELLSVITLSGIPAGAQLFDGVGNLLFTSTGGPVTIELSDGSHIQGATADLTMTAAAYEALRVLPPNESHANFTVVVSVTSYEVTDGGTPIVGVAGATSTTNVTVQVQAITDPVELSLVDGGDGDVLATDHTIPEDSTFDLSDLLAASFPNTDGNATSDLDGSEIRWFEISGLPIGTTVNGVTVTVANPVITVAAPGLSTSATALPAMAITPPSDFSGDVTITVTLLARDSDSDGVGGGPTTGGVVQDSVTLDLHVTPVGGDVAGADVSTPEDTATAFLSGIAVTDTGASGSEVITQVVFDVPAGWNVADTGAGVDYTTSLVGTTYTIAFDSGLTESEREAILDGFRIEPPSHSSADVTIDVEVTTVDSVIIDGSNVSSTVTTTVPIDVTVLPVAEVVGADSDGDGVPDATMTPGHAYTTAGEEDAWFTLGVEGGFNLEAGWSNQDGDEQTYARLTPELVAGDGGSNSAIGSQFRYVNDEGDWVTATYTGAPIDIPLAYLDTLQFMAPANLSGSFQINVQTFTVDTDPDTGAQVEAVSGSAVLSNLVINPAADEVTLALNARATGLEDTPIPLDIRPTSSDPSETFTVTISNIPPGAQLYYDGVLQTQTAGSVTIADFDPGGGLTLQPPLNSNNDFTLNVSAVSVDGGDVSGSQNLTVDVSLKGVADAVTLVPVDVTYSESALDSGSDQVLLNELLSASQFDDDGSEVLTFRITGLPEGFTLSAGTMLVGGIGAERVWVLTETQFNAATIGTPGNFSGTQSFTVTPVTTEDDGNSLTGSPQIVDISVAPSPEAGVTTAATINEDALTPLGLAIVHQNGDTDETLTTVWVAVDDAETAAFTLYVGSTAMSAAGLAIENIGGIDYYVLTGPQIEQLAAQGAPNLDGALGSFSFKYGITDAGYGSTPAGMTNISVQDGTFTLTANPVTDPIALSITNIVGTVASTAVSDEHVGDDAALDTAILGAQDVVTVTLNIATTADAGSAGGTSDSDGSENVIRVVIEGVPEGVSVQGAQFSGAGTWLLIYEGAGALPINSSGGIDLPIEFDISEYAGDLDDVPITMQVQTQDRGGQGAGTAISSDAVTWHLTTNYPGEGGTIPARIDQWAYNGAHAGEDAMFSLSDVVDAQVTIMDPTVANAFTVSLTAVLPGTTIVGMVMTVVDGQPVWTASVTVPPGGDGTAALQNLLDSIGIIAPANNNENNSAGQFQLDASLTVSVPSGSSDRAVIENMAPPVDPATDAAVISISPAAINEGVTSMPVTITVSNDADGSFGEIVDGKLYVKVDAAGSTNGLASGTLTYNGVELPTETVDGELYYVITGVTAGAPIELSYEPDDSTAGQVSFSALVRSQEDGSSQIVTTNVSATGEVIMINNGVTVTSGPSTGSESSHVPITGIVVALVDNDGSESINTVLLSNVPNGFLVYVGASAGTAGLASNAGGDNTWVISNPDGSMPAYVAIVPPDYWSGTLDGLTVTVESGETVFSDGLIQNFELGDITIVPVANGVDLTATNTFGQENRVIPLNLNASMADPADASLPGANDANQETTTLKLTGLGQFASFFIGSDQLASGISYDAGTDTYTLTGLTQSDLDQLGLLQARNALTDQDGTAPGVQIAVEAFTTDGSSVSASDTVNLTINSFAQLPTSGDDTLLWTGNAINAGAGTDTILLREGEILSGSQLDGRLSNVEALDLNGNAISSLSAADVLGITGSGGSILTLLGDADDALTLGGSWTSAGTQEVGGIEYAIYTSTVGATDVELHVQSGVAVD
jgi:T1SS-143 domain-containing protein